MTPTALLTFISDLGIARAEEAQMRGWQIFTCLSLIACTGGAVAAVAKGAVPTGAICIAPFHVQEPSPTQPPRAEPIMSQDTRPPSTGSVFTFLVDRRLKATVRNHEMALVRGVSTERKVKVEVRLDGKPFETFWLDLRNKPDHRACLRLYPGYWHWIDQGWDAKLGCKCAVEAP
jgi:hypothetical protein